MPNYQTLSEVLTHFEEARHYSIYKRIKGSVREGKLIGVPLMDQVNIYRTTKPLVVQQLLIGDGQQELAKWITQTKEELTTPRTKRFAVSREDIESGKVDFAEAAKRYRESLQVKGKKKAKKKTL
jgi:hypothetical protein